MLPQRCRKKAKVRSRARSADGDPSRHTWRRRVRTPQPPRSATPRARRRTPDDAGDPVGDRQDRGQLRPVVLDVGRERPRTADDGFGFIEQCGYLVHVVSVRSSIIFLISAIALPGFKPFGQVRVQLRMVWQR